MWSAVWLTKLKQLRGLRMCVLKYGSRLEKAAQKRKSEFRQRSKVERHLLYDPGWWSTEWKLEIMLKTLEVSMEMLPTLAKEGRCQKHTHRARLRKLKGEGLHHRPDSQKEVCMCCEGHESPRERLEIFSAQKSWRPHFRKRIYLNDPLQFRSSAYSDGASCSGQGLEEGWDNSFWQLGKVKSMQEVILGAQRDEKIVHFAT